MRDPGDSAVEGAVPLTLRLPPVIHAELKARADATGKSLNSLIVAAVRDMLDAGAARARGKTPPRGARPWASRSAPSGATVR